MKKALMILFLSTLWIGFALAQGQQSGEQQEDSAMLKEFTRSVQLDGVILNFVHLNDRTVDVLFQGPTKYSMRARANLATLVYVQGTPEKEVSLVTDYVLEYDGEEISGTSHNIKNFETGAVAAGERIDGLLLFDKKLDLRNSFKIKGEKGSVTFKLSDAALRMLGQ